MIHFTLLSFPWWCHQIEHFPRYCPFVMGIHRTQIHSPHKGHWRGAFMFSSICAWTNDWANNRDIGDLRRHRAHYDVNVMWISIFCSRVSVMYLFFYVSIMLVCITSNEYECVFIKGFSLFMVENSYTPRTRVKRNGFYTLQYSVSTFEWLLKHSCEKKLLNPRFLYTMHEILIKLSLAHISVFGLGDLSQLATAISVCKY